MCTATQRFRAVSGVADDAFLLRDCDQPRQEAGSIGRAVRDEGKPHDRRPHSPLGEAEYGSLHGNYETAGCPCAPRRREGPGRPRWAGWPRPSPGLPITACR